MKYFQFLAPSRTVWHDISASRSSGAPIDGRELGRVSASEFPGNGPIVGGLVLPSQSPRRQTLQMGGNVVLLVVLVLTLSFEVKAQTPDTTGKHDTVLYRKADEGGVRRWRISNGDSVPLYTSPSVRAQIIHTLNPGAVLSNLGCTDSSGQMWCRVRPFRGGPKGFLTSERLEPSEGPDGVVPMGKNDTRHRAGNREFDAKGDVRCAQEKGQALGLCEAAVARDVGGDATVVVSFPNGFARKLYFIHGEFVSASATMSGVGRDTDWRFEDGVHTIRVDDQRFELPDALVYGN